MNDIRHLIAIGIGSLRLERSYVSYDEIRKVKIDWHDKFEDDI